MPTKISINTKALHMILQSIEDVTEDDGYEANTASQALAHVRRMFYGTPFEQVLTDALAVCDAVHLRAEEIANS